MNFQDRQRLKMFNLMKNYQYLNELEVYKVVDEL